VAVCPALTSDGAASWPATLTVGTRVAGTCDAGWTGAPTRLCDFNGWGAVTAPCQQIACDATTSANTVVPSTFANTTVVGACVSGFGTANGNLPTRFCSLSRVLSDPTPACVQLSCGAEAASGATWPLTVAGFTANGTCPPGFSGTPTRACALNGVWLVPSGTCIQGQCSALTTDATATWAAAAGGETNVPGTCRAGYATANGNPPLRSCGVDLAWSATTNPCTRLQCAAVTSANVRFAQANAGDVATGTCPAGFAAVGGSAPTRPCLLSGAWGVTVGGCAQLFCPNGVVQFGAAWPNNTAAGQAVSGAFCLPGWTGFVVRACNLDGTWAVGFNGSCTQLFCPAQTDGNANWARTAATGAAQNVSGTCNDGFFGAPSRLCGLDGVWGSIIVQPCTLAKCPPLISDGNASWVSTTIGQAATGLCLNGLQGAPTRACLVTGVWGAIVGTCAPAAAPCPSVSCAGPSVASRWAAGALPGTTVAGVCCPMFVQAPGSPAPQRQCGANSTFGAVASDCVVDLSGSGGRVTNLQAARVPAAATPTVQLSWTSTSRDANLFKVYATSDGRTLTAVYLGAQGVEAITATTLMVAGLREATTYTFVVVAGDASGQFDASGPAISIVTAINGTLARLVSVCWPRRTSHAHVPPLPPIPYTLQRRW
jgi:hypothetical protein